MRAYHHKHRQSECSCRGTLVGHVGRPPPAVRHFVVPPAARRCLARAQKAAKGSRELPWSHGCAVMSTSTNKQSSHITRLGRQCRKQATCVATRKSRWTERAAGAATSKKMTTGGRRSKDKTQHNRPSNSAMQCKFYGLAGRGWFMQNALKGAGGIRPMLGRQRWPHVRLQECHVPPRPPPLLPPA